MWASMNHNNKAPFSPLSLKLNFIHIYKECSTNKLNTLLIYIAKQAYNETLMGSIFPNNNFGFLSQALGANYLFLALTIY